VISTQLYGVDVRRMRLRELLRYVHGPKGVLVWVLLQIGAAKAPVDLNHRVLPLWADTLSSWDVIHAGDAEAIRPAIDALLRCGYTGVAVHVQSEPLAQTDGAGAYLLHQSGTSFAFVGHVRNLKTGEALLATHVGSALDDGRVVSTTNQRSVLDNPITDNRWVRTDRADEVARVHAERLRKYDARIYRVSEGAELVQVIDSYTVRTFDAHVTRGVYVVGTPADQYTAGVCGV
jgi:hypothetical protein